MPVSTVMAPSYCSVIACTEARPMPLPSCFVEKNVPSLSRTGTLAQVFSTCTNSASDVSFTVTATYAPPSLTALQASTAFSSRFPSSTVSICSGNALRAGTSADTAYFTP